MKRYFADAAYFIALANPKDQWHRTAVETSKRIIGSDLITTEDILIELLNFYAESGDFMRRKVVELTRSFLLDTRVEIISRSESSFHEGLELYESRIDKGDSLTDCISMNVCRQLGLKDVLTSDQHFVQEGFTILS